jgi:hypothetical protein
MLDTHQQERFARRCSDAAFGYTSATTAAYAALTEQVFDFWAGMLTPPEKPASTRASAAVTPVWGWPGPAKQEPAPFPFPMMPMWPFAWAAPQHATSAPKYNNPATSYSPFEAWFAMFPFAAPSPAWPMAFMMMSSGVPRNIAWPTAEANVAAMEAAESAAETVQKVFSGYRTEGGHSVVRQSWPPVSLMMTAFLAPLSIGAVLSSMRIA